MNKIRNWGAASLAMLVPAVSMAEVTNPAAQVFTDLGTLAGLVLAAGYILMGIVITGLASMKIAKKVIGRST